MKKNLCVLLAAALLLFSFPACSGGGPSSSGGGQPAAAPDAAPDKVYEWKFASIYVNPTVSNQFNSTAVAQQYFCDIVKERTGGRVVVTPFYDGVLGTSNELFEQVRSGELEVYLGQPMSNYDPRFAAWSIPYLFNDFDEIRAVACDPESAIFNMSKEWLGEQGMELLAVGAGNLRGFINSKKEIKTVSDLRDLKVRTYQDPVVTAFWSGVCNASPLPMSEVYTSLQTKAIDGLEFAGSSVLGQKFYEVTKYYSNIDWQWCSSANLLVSQKAWNELPDDLKDIVQACATEAMAFQSETEIADVAKAKEQLEAHGIVYHELTGEERQTFIDYARTTDAEVKQFVGAQVFDAMFQAVETYRANR